MRRMAGGHDRLGHVGQDAGFVVPFIGESLRVLVAALAYPVKGTARLECGDLLPPSQPR